MELKYLFDVKGNKDNIISVNKVVTTFLIDYKRSPADLRIDIIQTENGGFVGISNYAIWSPEQAAPYKGCHCKETIEEALEDALEDYLHFDNSSVPDDLLFWESSNGTLYDGMGKKVTFEEAQKRRASYRK
jgi:hypothetical protein